MKRKCQHKGIHNSTCIFKEPVKLDPSITHINATPEFLANPKNVEMINKMVELAKKIK